MSRAYMYVWFPTQDLLDSGSASRPTGSHCANLSVRVSPTVPPPDGACLHQQRPRRTGPRDVTLRQRVISTYAAEGERTARLGRGCCIGLNSVSHLFVSGQPTPISACSTSWSAQVPGTNFLLFRSVFGLTSRLPKVLGDKFPWAWFISQYSLIFVNLINVITPFTIWQTFGNVCIFYIYWVRYPKNNWKLLLFKWWHVSFHRFQRLSRLRMLTPNRETAAHNAIASHYS